jgi:hypothetical protein
MVPEDVTNVAFSCRSAVFGFTILDDGHWMQLLNTDT